MNLRSLVFAESEKLRLDHIYYLILGLNFNSLYCLTLSLTPSTFFFSLAHSTPFLSQSPLNHHHCDSRGDSASTTDVPSTSFNKVFGICLRLTYLHEEIKPKVVHRDIKSSNILIDDDFNAKIFDFGLAKLLGVGKSHITTRVMGTLG
ncbi:hypothetical protein JHK82_012651 [Glycine max]|uniref:non-specific serine/threonine protein kinase n=2 Tax=Glycine subgen. Soja TaxID=1462606 RepID=K7KPM7_SOYBN|nr:hypothetical protein JHK85_013005 [Glycine max]KAG5057676.1 hypothetical protein JHK86_012672 [Glycine max]KAG5154682.1 hypothetical protein JHK82_012651 [Glycine max]